MRVLIIGGTGNISTAITRDLAARGDEVVLFNRGHGPPPAASVSVLVGDRTDHAAFEAPIAAAGRFDGVIDMIGYHPADAESSGLGCASPLAAHPERNGNSHSPWYMKRGRVKPKASCGTAIST